jgi:dodecin
MQEHVYKKIEVVGSSEKSIADAVQNAVKKAGETVKNLRWFEVAEIRGDIEDGKVAHFQATVKIGFRLEDEG